MLLFGLRYNITRCKIQVFKKQIWIKETKLEPPWNSQCKSHARGTTTTWSKPFISQPQPVKSTAQTWSVPLFRSTEVYLLTLWTPSTTSSKLLWRRWRHNSIPSSTAFMRRRRSSSTCFSSGPLPYANRGVFRWAHSGCGWQTHQKKILGEREDEGGVGVGKSLSSEREKRTNDKLLGKLKNKYIKRKIK